MQDIAERLLRLPARELGRLRCGESTRLALDEATRIRDPRALRRHIKHLANVLERESLDEVNSLLERASARDQAAVARQHALERWRERLIDEGDTAIEAFIAAYPGVDRQQLRALARLASRDRARAEVAGPRRLFRFLRETMGQD